jgi:hypothetical protein
MGDHETQVFNVALDTCSNKISLSLSMCAKPDS